MFSRDLLGSRRGRLATFGILYVSEGIPLGFAAVAMAAYMRRQGLDVGQIGAFVGSFYLPWAFKWAWAPLVDLVKLERFGGRKAWIALCQALMIVTLFGIAQVDYTSKFKLLIALVLVHNFFSATQDIAIDSLAINTLRPEERATANGFMFGGAYIGQGLGGGGAMFVSGRFGFDVSFLYVSLLLTSIFTFVLLFVRDPSLSQRVAHRASDVWTALVENIRTFVRELVAGFFQSGVGPMVGVVFALLPAGAMALSAAISSTMQVDLGMSDGQIAQLNIYQTILSGVGCVVGGWAADHLGQRKMLAAWYLLTTLPTLYLATALATGGGLGGITIAQYFWASLVFSWCMGMHYGTSAALFMGLTNPLVAATQFTGYMALRNLTISYTNMWQGVVADSQGYATVLYIDALLVALPVLLLPLLKPSTRAAQVPPSKGAPLPEAG
jgi:PAT family beta-lactamase induction signal transducer AmpG